MITRKENRGEIGGCGGSNRDQESKGGAVPDLNCTVSLSPTVLGGLTFFKHCCWDRLMIQPPLLQRMTMSNMRFSKILSW